MGIAGVATLKAAFKPLRRKIHMLKVSFDKKSTMVLCIEFYGQKIKL